MFSSACRRGISVMKQTRPFCLASASPRRREFLAQLGMEFEVYPVDVDEKTVAGEPPEEYVQRLADLKAEMARHRYGDHLILAGDTAVVLDSTILGKPGDAENTGAMLNLLSGKTHRVLSAYRLLDGSNGEDCRRTLQTLVAFKELPPEWIEYYSHLPEGWDKAGGYAIQGIGAVMVESIQGSYSTVVGFPMEAIFWDLMEKGWITI